MSCCVTLAKNLEDLRSVDLYMVDKLSMEALCSGVRVSADSRLCALAAVPVENLGEEDRVFAEGAGTAELAVGALWADSRGRFTICVLRAYRQKGIGAKLVRAYVESRVADLESRTERVDECEVVASAECLAEYSEMICRSMRFERRSTDASGVIYEICFGTARAMLG